MNTNPTQTTIVCPFCPVGCDDLVVRIPIADKPGDTIPVIDVPCDLARSCFAFALAPSPPRVGNQISSIDDTVRLFRKTFLNAKWVEFVSRDVDIVTAKRLSELVLAGRLSWLINQLPFDSAWLRTSSREGIIAATLSDVRQHADVIWSIGTPADTMPRLMQRIVDSTRTVEQFNSAGPLDPLALAEIVRRTLYVRVPKQTPAPEGLRPLLEAITRAKYLTIVLGENAFEPGLADATLSMLVRWCWDLNGTRRANVLKLDPAPTSRSVYRWRTNRSLPETDNVIHEIRIRLQSNDPNASMIVVSVGAKDPGRSQSEIHIPTATIGVHRRGAMIRGDGTVTQSLSSIASTNLPTIAELLADESAV